MHLLIDLIEFYESWYELASLEDIQSVEIGNKFGDEVGHVAVAIGTVGTGFQILK